MIGEPGVARAPIASEITLTRDGCYRQLEQFVTSIRDKKALPAPVEEGMAWTRVGLAATESAERGAHVAPPEMEP